MVEFADAVEGCDRGANWDRIYNTPSFRLLYSFPTKEEAEAHANSFRVVGTRVVPCDERGAQALHEKANLNARQSPHCC